MNSNGPFQRYRKEFYHTLEGEGLNPKKGGTREQKTKHRQPLPGQGEANKKNGEQNKSLPVRRVRHRAGVVKAHVRYHSKKSVFIDFCGALMCGMW